MNGPLLGQHIFGPKQQLIKVIVSSDINRNRNRVLKCIERIFLSYLIRIGYKWHYSCISLHNCQTGTTQTAGA